VSKPVIKIVNSMDEESFVVVVDGVYVGSANHDSDGWDGMDSVRKIMKSTAKAIGYKFVETYEESDE
jgi:hypothetical protein